MVLDIASFLTSTLQKQWKTNHLDKKSDIYVVEASQVGRRFRMAVEEEFTKTFLNDAEFVAAITCTKASPEPDKQEDEESNVKPEDGDTGKNPKTEPDGGEKTSDPSDGDGAEELNESVKVQDLTTSMLSVPKGVSNPKSKKCVSETEKGKKDDKTKGADPKKGGKTTDPETEEKVDEAETEATGDKLKLKVQEAIRTALQIKDVNQKVDLEELPDYQEGYDVYFMKLAFKTKKSDATEEG